MCEHCGFDREKHAVVAELIFFMADDGEVKLHGEGDSDTVEDITDKMSAERLAKAGLFFQQLGENLGIAGSRKYLQQLKDEGIISNTLDVSDADILQVIEQVIFQREIRAQNEARKN